MAAATYSDHVLVVAHGPCIQSARFEAQPCWPCFGASRGRRSRVRVLPGASDPLLVVLEVALSDLSGYEVCRQLRDEFGEELPIILVSGERVDPLDRAVGLLIGADDYLVKPLDADEFLARVREKA